MQARKRRRNLETQQVSQPSIPESENEQNAGAIDKLNQDVLTYLIDFLDPVDAVCLALTSHKYHDAVVAAEAKDLKEICPMVTLPEFTVCTSPVPVMYTDLCDRIVTRSGGS